MTLDFQVGVAKRTRVGVCLGVSSCVTSSEAPAKSGQTLVVNGASVALDETAREVSERQVLPAGGLRKRLEQ